jgi:hypothetical protein
MTGREHSLDTARTLLRVAESATDRLIANRLKAIASNCERWSRRRRQTLSARRARGRVAIDRSIKASGPRFGPAGARSDCQLGVQRWRSPC